MPSDWGLEGHMTLLCIFMLQKVKRSDGPRLRVTRRDQWTGPDLVPHLKISCPDSLLRFSEHKSMCMKSTEAGAGQEARDESKHRVPLCYYLFCPFGRVHNDQFSK